jgi:hypothetical protein
MRPLDLLEQEARALLVRVDAMRPFALHDAMVPAAAPSVTAQAGIEYVVAQGRRELRRDVRSFLSWLRGAGSTMPAAQAQRRFTVLRLRFNIVLSQFDLFASALTQRSEPETGVWLAGLDALAADALRVSELVEAVPIVCYLERGPGAAIRRARTRMPGGKATPTALVRVPRERMIGTGIASSLVHEVGHQGAAILDLVPSLREDLRRNWRGSRITGLYGPTGYRRSLRIFGRWRASVLRQRWD